MTTTTAPVQQQQRSEKDPMRFHLHYHHGKGKGKGKAGTLRTPAGAVLWSASRRGWSERNGDRRVPGHQLCEPLSAWALVNHVIQFLENSWHGLLNGTGVDPRRSSCSTSSS